MQDGTDEQKQHMSHNCTGMESPLCDSQRVPIK